jgi:hypothetical protein
MATTTNYGWVTPDDTDLVKDGAAAIRTLGTSIDTSFAADEGDLLVGGTSDIFEALPIGAAGTVLTSDGDTAEWVAPATGAYTLLASGNFSTGSATLAITSIPNTYQELYVVLRDVAPSTTPAQIQMRLNNDSSALYESTTTSPLKSAAPFTQTIIGITGGRNVFNTGVDNFQVIRIPGYANTNAFKLLTSSYLVQEDASNWSGGLNSGFYRSNTAISEINFLNSGGFNWAAGSYELFGVK